MTYRIVIFIVSIFLFLSCSKNKQGIQFYVLIFDRF